eukprot:s1199_g4.t1
MSSLRVRIGAADHTFAKIRAKHLDALVRMYPYDKSGTRVFSIVPCPAVPPLERQTEILEATQERPDPWESCYIPPPDEPVTGMKEVPKDILEWEYAAALESASKRVKEQAAERREAVSSSGIPHTSFDEVVSAMPYRTESHRTFTAIKEAMTAEAGSSGFMKARPADYVGINYQDDLDLMEMLGYTDELTCPSEPEGPADYVGINYQDDLDLMEMLGYTDELTCPSEPEGEGMITVLPEMIPRDDLPPPRLSDKVLHHMTGLVRGAKQKFKSRIGKWVKISELIDVLWKSRQVNCGDRHILSIFAYDSKGRFNDQLVDADIATCWHTNDERSEIGDTATYQDRPFLASKGEYPPRLYHRTTNDSAFSIWSRAFKQGYGKSGKFHNYFAKATLAELENKAGSRANLPIELVLCTEEANRVAYLFETTSEGVLTRDFVPGSCILYIRDTLKSTILGSRQDPNDQEAEVVENVPEPDVFPDAVEGDPAPLSGGPELVITKEDLAQDILMPEPSAPLALQDATASDLLPEEAPVLGQGGIASPPESRKREADEISVTLEVEEEANYDADDIALEEAAPLHYASAPPQPKAVPLSLPPAPSTGGRHRACQYCGSQHIVGQMLCLGCGVHIQAVLSEAAQTHKDCTMVCRGGCIKGSRQAATQLTPEEVMSEMVRGYTTSRGSQSLDGEA